jgi:hypothetical protein
MPLKTFNLVKLVLPILLDSCPLPFKKKKKLDSCPLPLIFIALNFLYYAEHSLDKPSSADLIKWIPPNSIEVALRCDNVVMNYAQNAASGSHIQDDQGHFVFGYAT